MQKIIQITHCLSHFGGICMLRCRGPVGALCIRYLMTFVQGLSGK